MENTKSGRSLNGNGPPGPVPFPGIGTRLRRSRSKDQSGDQFDSISAAEMETMGGLKQRHNGFPQYSSGTLERPKRLFTGYGHRSEIGSSTFINQVPPPPQPLYGLQRSAKNGSTTLYDDNRQSPTPHQYEEPQYLLDHFNRGTRKGLILSVIY